MPVNCRTRLVLPWSMCPAVPTITYRSVVLITSAFGAAPRCWHATAWPGRQYARVLRAETGAAEHRKDGSRKLPGPMAWPRAGGRNLQPSGPGLLRWPAFSTIGHRLPDRWSGFDRDLVLREMPA